MGDYKSFADAVKTPEDGNRRPVRGDRIDRTSALVFWVPRLRLAATRELTDRRTAASLGALGGGVELKLGNNRKTDGFSVLAYLRLHSLERFRR
jgi:hypothetical protein